MRRHAAQGGGAAGRARILAKQGDMFAAGLASVQALQPSNQLVVSASRLSDGAPRALAVEFSWEPLPDGLAFSDEFVTNPLRWRPPNSRFWIP